MQVNVETESLKLKSKNQDLGEQKSILKCSHY